MTYRDVAHKLKLKVILIYLLHSQITYSLLVLDFQDALSDLE